MWRKVSRDSTSTSAPRTSIETENLNTLSKLTVKWYYEALFACLMQPGLPSSLCSRLTLIHSVNATWASRQRSLKKFSQGCLDRKLSPPLSLTTTTTRLRQQFWWVPKLLIQPLNRTIVRSAQNTFLSTGRLISMRKWSKALSHTSLPCTQAI